MPFGSETWGICKNTYPNQGSQGSEKTPLFPPLPHSSKKAPLYPQNEQISTPYKGTHRAPP